MKTISTNPIKSFFNKTDLEVTIFGKKLILQVQSTKMDKYKSYDPMKQRLLELANNEW